MMVLSKYDSEKLHHDLKRIAKGLKLIKDEIKDTKGSYILELLVDEFDRLQQDIKEMTE